MRGVRVLVLTTSDLDAYVYGPVGPCEGVLLKDVLPEDPREAILAVADGGALVAPQVLRRLVGSSRPDRSRGR